MHPLRRHGREQLAQSDRGCRKGERKRGLRRQQTGEARLACQSQLFEIRGQIGQDHIIARDTRHSPNMTVHIDGALQLLRNRTRPEEIRHLMYIQIGRFECAIQL